MKCDSIIFDVDGTMWNTTDLCASAWNAAIEDNSELLPNLTGERLSLLFGRPMNVIFAELFPSASEEERTYLAEKCCEYEERLLSERTVPLYEGVSDGIRRLAERYPLYIVSNCQKGYIEAFLENSGLGGCFEDFLCYGDTLAPKGETIKQLISKNNLKSPVYVGDTKGDSEASAHAGIPFVWVKYGFGKDVPCDKSADSFAEVVDIF